MIKGMPEEKKKELNIKGDALAMAWFQELVEQSDTTEMMMENIVILQVACCRALGSMAFNYEMQFGASGQKFIDEISKRMKAYLQFQREAKAKGGDIQVFGDSTGLIMDDEEFENEEEG